ncbi:alanine/glycine:cation symporter family protein [Pseudemcibacter aquimaris]|uniref:alanine/glycine:cation symporter family protein n=1 Tax=Pseudemcibacter aquimaris TaxID=2857064 RepID=UPI00201355F4|nr:amino acid carrier protein [Pseudemcibacter aquimaris]MCC3860546.1 amino acid carrier protein [Pseudemcibacter aquimaris]WDU59370.1 amino acid carrier protein [Pseudemcibacter aquimaris]
MEANLAALAAQLNAIVWGPIMLALLLGTGVYLTIGLKFMPVRRLKAGFQLLFSKQSMTHTEEHDGITPLQSLMTALSGTIGAGNIIGVASAILIGGPGAIFWMWMTALCGMATKYAEAIMAIKYRTRNEEGMLIGGPMYYGKISLGKIGAILGVAYAIMMVIAGLATGHMVQANAISVVLNENFGVNNWVTAVGLSILVFGVIIGGLQSIARMAEITVPTMSILYLLFGTGILIMNAGQIPQAFGLIFDGAFNGTAAVGGFAGAAIAAAIQQGVSRGLYSNEAGTGSAAIAHASSETKEPIRQGEIAMLGTVIDTIIICTFTSLIILTVQIEMGGVVQSAWLFGDDGNAGATLTSQAFAAGIPGGGYVVIVGQLIFSFTTIIAWSLYVERAGVFLSNEKYKLMFRLSSVAVVFLGCVGEFSTIWAFGLASLGLMAAPNLIILLLNSPEIFKLTKEAHAARIEAAKQAAE